MRWRSDVWVPDDPLEVLWDGPSLCDEGKKGKGSEDESSADGEGSHGLGYLDLNAHRLCDVKKTETLVKEAYSRYSGAGRFQTVTMNGAESVVQLGPSTSFRVLCRLLVSVQYGYGSESIVFEL